MPFRHNNFVNNEDEKINSNKKKLPHLNENYAGKMKNKGGNYKNSQNQKKEFMKTLGNFSQNEKTLEIRDIQSQAGSDLVNFKTIEVFDLKSYGFSLEI